MNQVYLTVAELSEAIRYSEQSIYNLVCDGTFQQGLHFFKPTSKKLLFKWEAIVDWVEGRDSMLGSKGLNEDPQESGILSSEEPNNANVQSPERTRTPKSSINI